MHDACRHESTELNKSCTPSGQPSPRKSGYSPLKSVALSQRAFSAALVSIRAVFRVPSGGTHADSATCQIQSCWPSATTGRAASITASQRMCNSLCGAPPRTARPSGICIAVKH